VWLIAGLGNPEARYEGTRHNVGFEVADALAERAAIALSEKKFKARLGRGRLAGSECLIMKPQTYMNLSGESVGPALGFFKLTTDRLIVVHDDLDLDLGKNRLKQGGGHGGHNGLRSLMQHLPDASFIRIRMGIGRPPPGWDPADFVLAKFTSAERKVAEKAVADAADAIEAIIKDGLSRAMNVYNRDPNAEKAKASRKEKPSGAGTESADEKERGNGQHA
jgi:peptidyl-tRNA hydrolase, PTH1 family